MGDTAIPRASTYALNVFIFVFSEYEFCGRRGLCDFATGLCECLDGWTGGACSVESYVYSTSNAIPGISLSASGLDYTGNVLEASTEKRVRKKV